MTPDPPLNLSPARSRMRAFLLVLVLAAASPIAAQRAFDSAGTHMIQYGPVPSKGPIVLSAPTLRLSDAGCELNRVVSIVLQSSGGMVIGNGGNLELCFYDAAGRLT